MPITIVNDTGQGLGTKIIADDGVNLCQALSVESIQIGIIESNSINRATIVLGIVKTEIKAHHTEWVTKDPLSSKFEKISSIVFANGNKIVFDEQGEITAYKNGGITKIVSLSDGRSMKFRDAPI